MEVDFLKKKLGRGLSLSQKRKMVNHEHKTLSISQQCELLCIHRSGMYYKPRGEDPLNLYLMRLIDETICDRPFYGVRRMAHHMRHSGHLVN
jgi:putative transposase